jgi:SAM-dependent methyltransferase
MNYPDVSEVLRGEVLANEDKTWLKLIHEKEHLAELLKWTAFTTVLEVGCGTGLYARILRLSYPHIDYLGLDANPEALLLARERNPLLRFTLADFREINPSWKKFDLVCAHAFLKHFSIAEWPGLFAKFLGLGRIAQFDMQTAYDTLNDGSASFGNNLWVPRSMLDDILAAAGHEIVTEEIAYELHDRRATIFLTKERAS